MNSINIFNNLGDTALSVIQAVLPLLLILVLFQVLFLKLPASYVVNLLKGTAISAVGLLLFLQGINTGFLPYGQAIGQAMSSLAYRWLMIPFGLIIGFLTAWSEPAVRILCDQVEQASSGAIRKMVVLIAICLGVAIFVAVAMARMVYDIPLLYILIPGYALAIIMFWLTQKEFLAIAVDAGGVATGPITNTFLLSLGLGLSSASSDQNLATSGLGIIALVTLAPIISVMALGIVVRIKHRQMKAEAS
ncbi:MAG: DUF1538 domain-containing protein [Dehalococcoidia bacterium]|nr:DUF1538 domain-containing protein [Dehalococcoidia bacterium]